MSRTRKPAAEPGKLWYVLYIGSKAREHKFSITEPVMYWDFGRTRSEARIYARNLADAGYQIIDIVQGNISSVSNKSPRLIGVTI